MAQTWRGCARSALAVRLAGNGEPISLTRRDPMRLLLGLAFSLALVAAAGAEGKFTPVDLQSKANHRLADDLHATQGNHLGNVPKGVHQLEGMTFRIDEKMIHMRGVHAQDMPDKVEGIKVDAKFDRLQILHSTGYGEGDPEVADGTEIGSYVVHYADDRTEKIPIVYGEDLRDWWINPNRSGLKRAKVAWSGTNPAAEGNGRKIALYSVAWTNPHPDKEVKSIEIVSKGTECDPFVIALTLEKK
jgi:hypothetical protein